MSLTAYQAKYFAHDLTRRVGAGMERLSMALFDASVDLNPHQIEAALFALESPLSKGVLLADEVGLGKTIEAGIVLCQYWAERKRQLIVICPASIRQQWAQELEDKFNLPVFVIDSKTYRAVKKSGREPLQERAVIIISLNYAYRLHDELKSLAWDLVVIDEAHKLRNAHRSSNKVGQAIRSATADCRKLLVTATPLQNSLLELYGLSTLIDETLFGDVNLFRERFEGSGGSLTDLRVRLSKFCKRTLRDQVKEYIQYTARRPITRPFNPTDDEHKLYEAVSEFLQRPESYALPRRQRHLTALVLRKLLASSSHAIAGTLVKLRERLEELEQERHRTDAEFAEDLIVSEELSDELLDEILAEDDEEEADEAKPKAIDRKQLAEEIAMLQKLAVWAESIGTDTKSRALVAALGIGFEQMAASGAQRKALVFTESRRTQEYLKRFLESSGYGGQVLLFNGSNNAPEATAIYEKWLEASQQAGRRTRSRDIDIRAALIENFKDSASIMIATEAAAEGVNLQFCSLVVNYDLPWNPQRIEQRIGRCHRYGQKHDVVVINFLNERNEVDRRVLELLTQKFELFSGVFGASDKVLGTIESGVDFEQRIFEIYQTCRTQDQIESAFTALQKLMDEKIRTRMDETRQLLLERLDEDVHQRLRLRLEDARAQLDRFGRRFWDLTGYMLAGLARFDDDALAFDLQKPPALEIERGRYHLITKNGPRAADAPRDERNDFLYRLSHPLGEHVVASAKRLAVPPARIVFDVSSHPTRVHVVEALRGKSGHVRLTRLEINSLDTEEYLLFSGFDSDGQSLDQETFEKLLSVGAVADGVVDVPETVSARLEAESKQHAQATLNLSLEQNSTYFNDARDKLDKWADDMVLSAEKALKDTKEQIKGRRRQLHQAPTLEQQHTVQKELQLLEKKQRRQRKEIFETEDEIAEKRDALVSKLEARLAQKTTAEELFTIEWQVK